MSKANEPAFPVEISVADDGAINGMQTGPTSGFALGLSKREYLAGQAMIGLLSNPNGKLSFDEAACDAARYADVLIAELEKSPLP